MAEPVEDQQQDPDRHQRDDRLQLLSIVPKRLEQISGQDEEERRQPQGRQGAESQRPLVASVDADHAREQGSEDQDRFQPFSEDDCRRVEDDRARRRPTGAERLLSIGQGAVERLPGRPHFGQGGAAGDDIGQAAGAAVALPEELLDAARGVGGEGEQLLLRSGLEDGVGFQASRLGLAVLARRHRRFHLVEEGSDDVEVGVAARSGPLRREDRRQPARGSLDVGFDCRRAGDRPAGRGGGEGVAGAGQEVGDLGGRRRVPLPERQPQIGERGAGPVEECLRLLNLEIDDDLALLHPPSVLDWHQRQVPKQLSGTATLFRP